MTEQLRNFFRNLARLKDVYRPELHYMRGPGPAWHAKQGEKNPQLRITTKDQVAFGPKRLSSLRSS